MKLCVKQSAELWIWYEHATSLMTFVWNKLNNGIFSLAILVLYNDKGARFTYISQ